MKYCQDCGTGHDCEAEEVGSAEKTAVAIARLETTRDIEVARINAGAAKIIAETQAEADIESAASELEGVIEGVELATGEAGEPDADDVAPSIVVQGDTTADDTPDVEEPPEVTQVPVAASGPKRWDDAYR